MGLVSKIKIKIKISSQSPHRTAMSAPEVSRFELSLKRISDIFPRPLLPLNFNLRREGKKDLRHASVSLLVSVSVSVSV